MSTTSRIRPYQSKSCCLVALTRYGKLRALRAVARSARADHLIRRTGLSPLLSSEAVLSKNDRSGKEIVAVKKFTQEPSQLAADPSPIVPRTRKKSGRSRHWSSHRELAQVPQGCDLSFL